MTDSKELPIPSKSQVLETLSDYSEEKLREYFHSLFPTSNEDIYTMIDLLWLLTMNSVPGWSFTDKSSEEIDDIFNRSLMISYCNVLLLHQITYLHINILNSKG